MIKATFDLPGDVLHDPLGFSILTPSAFEFGAYGASAPGVSIFPLATPSGSTPG